MKHKLIGIDLAKNVFQVCAVNQAGELVFNHTVGRARLPRVMAAMEPTTAAVEACASMVGREQEDQSSQQEPVVPAFLITISLRDAAKSCRCELLRPNGPEA